MEYDSKKARNMRENPRISFVVDDFTSGEECWGCAKSIRGVMMSGKAELISKGKIHQIGRDLIYKKYPKYQETYPIKEGGWSRHILVITPTNVKSRGLQPN
jgi:nitroimidazol reductase NimA-like FMN-containing flavoprotein (pyridoxamine 5'-phosphate oxidase superfamily)